MGQQSRCTKAVPLVRMDTVAHPGKRMKAGIAKTTATSVKTLTKDRTARPKILEPFR